MRHGAFGCGLLQGAREHRVSLPGGRLPRSGRAHPPVRRGRPGHGLRQRRRRGGAEAAGGQYDGSIGVFGGAGANRYVQHVYSHQRIVETLGQTQILVANELGFLASRVSYKLDLRGPAVSLRTACSTALVAAHTACRSLLAGECDLALSGGVHVDPNPGTGYLYQEGSFVSPDGHVRPFDADARGTVFGTGVGVVAL
ncbi:beta-ketoacyl synthase N-terminal-like domain-containing protein, partial [Streptomyces sp. NRRL S-15]|uniref:beta-ketoacyl synthase N-terminal-like domain-containing protein n=1 Tax=Streptomyces sp. NRRL S-15 TaxID=1463886 RepID=UPI003B633861